ncbi:acyloxyacyl hydrolase [Pollutimonas nitritireducens]|nr:acyloxyacyl hydrolase [Pollutimonas nitritireducens]
MHFMNALPQFVFRHVVPVIALAVLAAALPAGAQPVGSSQPVSPTTIASDTGRSGNGLGLRIGYFDDYRNVSLFHETAPWWSYRLQNGWGRLDLNGELGLTYWDATHGRPDSLWQLSATPMLRWWPNEFVYTEIGVGATVLSRTRFADKNLGSAFQFGNHIGVGVLISPAHQVGLRFSHFSNAGIKEPNDGLDVVQLTYTYRY